MSNTHTANAPAPTPMPTPIPTEPPKGIETPGDPVPTDPT